MKRFLETLKRPMTIGVTVGTALFIFFVSVQGPACCRDGWLPLDRKAGRVLASRRGFL